MSRLIRYIKETRAELKHVSWPTRRQAVLYTASVLVIALLTAGFLGLFDFIFTGLLEAFVL